jgi:hypothetical protein
MLRDRRLKQVEVDRLGQVGDKPGDARWAYGAFVHPAHSDRRRRRAARQRAQGFQHIRPVQIGQMHVEQEQRRRIAARQIERLVGAATPTV